MNQREKIILIATLVIIVGAVAFSLMGGDETKGGSGAVPGSGSGLKGAQKQFSANLEVLENADGTRRAYKAIEIGVSDPVKVGRPEQKLSDELYALLTDRLHVPNPRIGTGVFSRIPDVDEYCYIDISVDISGSYGEVINLLKEMSRLGLLIKTFKISQRNRNEADQVDVNITVSRLVKVDDKIRRKLLQLDKRGGA